MKRQFFALRGGARWREHSPPSETGSPEANEEENQVARITTHRRFTARRGGRIKKHHNHHHHGRSERISRETNGERKTPQADSAHPPPQGESESDRNKREADVRVSAKFVKRFTKEGHSGRIPPDPSALPAEFECIHCQRVVKREENSHPWHEGVLRNPGYLILKAPRFSAGEYEPCDDAYCANDDAVAGKVWSCCGRGEDEEPRGDWWNVRFSRGDPRWREGVRVPPPQDCEPTYHEDEKGAAGWHGWRLRKNGVVSKDPWKI
ncbi:hypothetical protein F4782DRAFT_529034 [Xylaria castorea]|nr:hypothetical protein F4782DRAFT_529034 [Xylaria castorea]